jgi:hypothetical protein
MQWPRFQNFSISQISITRLFLIQLYIYVTTFFLYETFKHFFISP